MRAMLFDRQVASFEAMSGLNVKVAVMKVDTDGPPD